MAGHEIILLHMEKKQAKTMIVADENSDQGEMLRSIPESMPRAMAIENRNEDCDTRVKSILNAVEVSVVLLDDKFSIQFFNKNFERLLLKLKIQTPTLRDSIFKIFNYVGLSHPFTVNLLQALDGKRSDFTQEHSVNDSETLVMQYKIEPVIDREKVTGVTLLVTDYTEKITQERTLKIQNEELKEVNSELDRFVYSASHDLRAPLMSIRGIVNLVRNDDDPASRQQYLSHIDKSISRLDKFISEIVNYSRIERTQICQQLIDFKEVIQESIDYLKYMEDALHVESIKEINDLYPFYSDRSRIVMIFNSIIANAVQYRDRRKKSFVKISVLTTPEEVCIHFKDNGIGIDPEHTSRIFDMFYRAHYSGTGSGLGLYNVKKAIEKLNGSIDVVSKVNEGSTFSIFIPNTKAHLL